MAKRLISGETHHDLLIFEGLMALINISTSFQGSRNPNDVSEVSKLVNLECGLKNVDQAVQNRPSTLYKVLAKGLITDKNPRVKLAACELLSNLSLSQEVQTMASEADPSTSSSPLSFALDVENLVGTLLNQLKPESKPKDNVSYTLKLAKAIVGFLANLISFEGVREILAKS
mmetsp:Transcript_10405/g.17461  ORF Transcript_10405/g.17461 Transcript_10405/m.17461 type:complete len:173 (+) Transcript_10405:2206-2724(+)